jgi:hypothetical protein
MNAFTPITPMVGLDVDPKLAFLARAATRFELVEAGEMDIDQAFDGLVVCLSCACARACVERWERDYPYQGAAVRRRHHTPQSSIDAVLCCVHQRGIAALDEPKNIERLSRFSTDAKAQLNSRIEKLFSKKGIAQ